MKRSRAAHTASTVPLMHFSEAAARLQQQQLRVLVAIISIIILMSRAVRGLQFELATFGSSASIANISFVTIGSGYTGQNASYTAPAIWLTPDPRAAATKGYSNIGKIVYNDRIQFIDHRSVPNRTASFSTSFTFQIISTGVVGNSGSGMTFFISYNDEAPQHSDGRAFGLVSNQTLAPAQGTSQFFAVEFDTFQSLQYQDPSSSHIGIDINSLISSNLTDTSNYPELFLYSNYTFTAWIEYNASSTLIQVWMTNYSTATRPLQPCLQLYHDLSTVFQDSMYVGFSATNRAGEEGRNESGFALYAWNFTSDDLKPSDSKSNSKLLLALTLSSVLILAVMSVCGMVVWIAIRRIKRGKVTSRGPSNHGISHHDIELASGSLQRYSYRELRKAAQGFGENEKVGEGGFSSVYRGTLADGSTVAVKKLKEGLRREAEFSSEMRIISSIRHRNLLQLKGWCYEKGEALLVYEYMHNGSLDSYLFGNKKGTLQSAARFRILGGVAAALEYLHGGLGECVLHRDVKAANVLLTEDFEAMLGDFGLARLISHNQLVSMTAAGTPGYIAPEVVYMGKATDRADVYSFGVLALEVACGRRAIDGSLQPQEMRLVDWLWLLHQSNKLVEALDPSLQSEIIAAPAEEQQWRCVLHVALICCHPSPECRPTMRQVAQALQDTKLLPLPTTIPTYPISPMSWPSISTIVSSSGSSTSKTTSTSRSSKTLGRSLDPPFPLELV